MRRNRNCKGVAAFFAVSRLLLQRNCLLFLHEHIHNPCYLIPLHFFVNTYADLPTEAHLLFQQLGIGIITMFFNYWPTDDRHALTQTDVHDDKEQENNYEV